MLTTLIKQTNWSVLGAVFGFAIGFLVRGALMKSKVDQNLGQHLASNKFAPTNSDPLVEMLTFMI